MDLKPFLSNVTSWRRHFKDTSTKGYDETKRFSTIQEGAGFPENNIISVSPTKKTEEIAKSEINQHIKRELNLNLLKANPNLVEERHKKIN